MLAIPASFSAAHLSASFSPSSSSPSSSSSTPLSISPSNSTRSVSSSSFAYSLSPSSLVYDSGSQVDSDDEDQWESEGAIHHDQLSSFKLNDEREQSRQIQLEQVSSPIRSSLVEQFEATLQGKPYPVRWHFHNNGVTSDDVIFSPSLARIATSPVPKRIQSPISNPNPFSRATSLNDLYQQRRQFEIATSNPESHSDSDADESEMYQPRIIIGECEPMNERAKYFLPRDIERDAIVDEDDSEDDFDHDAVTDSESDSECDSDEEFEQKLALGVSDTSAENHQTEGEMIFNQPYQRQRLTDFECQLEPVSEFIEEQQQQVDEEDVVDDDDDDIEYDDMQDLHLPATRFFFLAPSPFEERDFRPEIEEALKSSPTSSPNTILSFMQGW